MKDTGLRLPLRESGPPLPRGRLGIFLLLAAELMFFVGILGAYVIVRKSAETWPPTYQIETAVKDSEGKPILQPYTPPAMDLTIPLVNALVLTAAMIAAIAAVRAAKRGNLRVTRFALTLTALFGLGFLGGVVAEFKTEAARGLTMWSGQYGSMLFLIIGVHAAHVLAGVVWHFVVYVPLLARPQGVSADRVEYLGIYWGFVAVLWWALLGILSA
jgi:heme/copper-type cytochrome/quinol oxidase subunit 3